MQFVCIVISHYTDLITKIYYVIGIKSAHMNGNRTAFLALIDDKLDVLRRTRDISPSSDCKKIKNSSLKSPHCNSSNGSKITFLVSLNSKRFKLKNILFQ